MSTDPTDPTVTEKTTPLSTEAVNRLSLSVCEPAGVIEGQQSAGQLFLNRVVQDIDPEMVRCALAGLLKTEHQSNSPQSLAHRHLCIGLGEVVLALGLDVIQEIQPVPPITFLPNLPEWLAGVCNRRGDVVSVIDLRVFLKMPPASAHSRQRILFAHSQEQELTTAFLVDEVLGIRTFEPSALHTPEPSMNAMVNGYLSGVTKHEGALIGILDFQKLFRSPEMTRFQQS